MYNVNNIMTIKMFKLVIIRMKMKLLKSRIRLSSSNNILWEKSGVKTKDFIRIETNTRIWYERWNNVYNHGNEKRQGRGVSNKRVTSKYCISRTNILKDSSTLKWSGNKKLLLLKRN